MKLRLAFGLVAALLSFGAAARADGGYFSGTTGARAAGRGGAFTARADDLSAVTHNPAGLAHLETDLLHVGNRFSYNAHAFRRRPTLDWGNTRGGVPPYTVFPEVENGTPFQALEPLLGVASKLGLRDFTFALSAHAPAGVSRQEFPQSGGQRYMMVEREALLVVSAATAAFRPLPSLGLGVSAQLVHVPRLRYSLVIDGNPFPGEANPVESELDMLATVTGSDPFTFDAVLGAWWRPWPELELALAGRVIPAGIDAASTLAIEPLSPAIDEEVVLRRAGRRADDVRLSFPLPLGARAGVRYRELSGDSELFDIELDLIYESWSRVERFRIESHGLAAHLLGQRVEVGRIDIDKQWRDTIGVHLGGDYAALPNLLSVRGGVFYESATAKRSHLHVDFAAGPQLGGALGASLFVLGVELALAYQYRHQPALGVSEGDAGVFQEVPGSQCRAPFTNPDTCHPEYLGQPAPAVSAGVYRAHAHALSLDALYRF